MKKITALHLLFGKLWLIFYLNLAGAGRVFKHDFRRKAKLLPQTLQYTDFIRFPQFYQPLNYIAYETRIAFGVVPSARKGGRR